VPPASTASTNRYDPQPTPSLANPGDTVDVQSGDTLYGIARRHNVSVAELMQLNNMSSTNLKLGQRLYLPQGVAASRSPAPPVQTASIQPPPLPPSGDINGKYNGSYTVRPGDSIYGISRSFGVPVTELQQANGITDSRGIKAGAVLRVPGGGNGSAQQPLQHVAVAPPAQQGAGIAVVSERHSLDAPADHHQRPERRFAGAVHPGDDAKRQQRGDRCGGTAPASIVGQRQAALAGERAHHHRLRPAERRHA
jgi:LysM repeat protein